MPCHDKSMSGFSPSRLRRKPRHYRLEPELADFIAQAMSITQQLLETGRVIGCPRKWSCPRRRSFEFSRDRVL